MAKSKFHTIPEEPQLISEAQELLKPHPQSWLTVGTKGAGPATRLPRFESWLHVSSLGFSCKLNIIT